MLAIKKFNPLNSVWQNSGPLKEENKLILMSELQISFLKSTIINRIKIISKHKKKTN